jgi:hypothetical protein
VTYDEYRRAACQWCEASWRLNMDGRTGKRWHIHPERNKPNMLYTCTALSPEAWGEAMSKRVGELERALQDLTKRIRECSGPVLLALIDDVKAAEALAGAGKEPRDA